MITPPLSVAIMSAIDEHIYRTLSTAPEARSEPRKAMVYIAGPLTHGDPEANAAEAHRVAGELMAAADKRGVGIAAFIPHAYLRCDANYPRHYEKWMESCFIALEACQALLRLPGHSPGADREVERARELGIPVFHYAAERAELCMQTITLAM